MTTNTRGRDRGQGPTSGGLKMRSLPPISLVAANSQQFPSEFEGLWVKTRGSNGKRIHHGRSRLEGSLKAKMSRKGAIASANSVWLREERRRTRRPTFYVATWAYEEIVDAFVSTTSMSLVVVALRQCREGSPIA